MVEFEQKLRGNIAVSVNPLGRKQQVLNHIDHVKSKGTFEGPKKVLIIGASSSYGLATRISLAFGAGADTIGVSYEKGPKSERNLGTAGWYNNIAFKEAAGKEGLIAKNFVQDAFSTETKQEVIDYIKNEFGGKVDLVVYSLASGRRTDPETGETYTSSIKAIGEPVVGPNINMQKEDYYTETLEPATEQEIEDTIKVMGGEDWELWLKALKEADVLTEGVLTTNYSYLGSELNHPYYGHGTLGRAKADCDEKADTINELLADINGKAQIVVATAVTTKASSVIPFFPVYCIGLYKVMSEKGTHETPIMHMDRIYRDMIYGDKPEYDEEGRLRPDSWELDSDTQAQTKALIGELNEENFNTDLTAYALFYKEFSNLSGFMVDGFVEKEVTIDELKAMEY
ncbi:enoyl-[acyl-carrier protein] reductase / trans-2-enoyl-CoA reductase (NAD+) [Alkalibacterium putridalgicola]|uniref:trans-2-enoyl-CoA reductase (NAD(+)) n=1 Tax=Alkalibacterium putridalgicola TaxID=426703 RepID=A0A1H7V9B2_9LACT|nr:enoyl-ACP reductase FabV [Alkalibacterium putridalgicola]GEK88640.1 trans-2-enoyl-CoA reductase [NADH] [Alkalibacterium putridalgicola]SEM05802.1 enoyl-[acyl-carrier protein] reductase / trans-2-enoyl-CoA reductase (NAD+) [Alkalibacterium putridalgicola]